jgi:hypothetical protein
VFLNATLCEVFDNVPLEDEHQNDSGYRHDSGGRGDVAPGHIIRLVECIYEIAEGFFAKEGGAGKGKFYAALARAALAPRPALTLTVVTPNRPLAPK